MKKLLLILLIFPFVINAQEKFERKFRKISEDFEIQVYGFGSSRTLEVGSSGPARNLLKAKKGHRLIFMIFKIKNTTNQKKLFDLKQFQIIDENSNVYNANLCARSGLSMKGCDDYEFKVKPNKKRGKLARIFFEPEIPKNVKLKYLRVNGLDLVDLDVKRL